MKRIAVLAMCLGLIFSAACGGGDGGGNTPADQEAEASFDDFATQLELCLQQVLGAQVVKPSFKDLVDATYVDTTKDTTGSCNCTNGGTIDYIISDDFQQVTVTIDNCVTAENNTYNGGASSTDGGATINGTLQPFGECSSGTASNISGDNCTGQVSATCPSGTVSCTVVDGEDDDCDLSC
jgi:hypothetical protein